MVNVHFPRPNAARAILLAALSLVALVACPSVPQSAPPAGPMAIGNAAGAAARWQVNLARGQSTYIPMDLPAVVAGATITVLSPAPAAMGNVSTAPGMTAGPVAPPDRGGPRDVRAGPTWTGTVELYSAHAVHESLEGPTLEQLTGRPRIVSDAGTYLTPVQSSPAPGGRIFAVAEPLPLYLRVNAPAVVEPGAYRVILRIETPGRPVEAGILTVDVADVAVPTAPRVLGVATTTVDELTRLYPATFGKIAGQYLNPADPDHQAAARQLDVLIKAARDQGIVLFVEDIIPALRVDELGQVTLDWDNYDRLMQPYMDGTAFDDHAPLGVWLAPVPPPRIRNSTSQLWQYIDLCARHFAAKRWSAVPVFLHPALGGGAVEPSADAAEKLRAQVADMMRLHMPRDMLAVAAPGSDVPHAQLWAVNDHDSRLPPAGALADEYSIRAWPWMCVARGNLSGAGGTGGTPTGVKGFLWRNALGGAAALPGSAATPEAVADVAGRPLFRVHDGIVAPTLRMVWLNAGMNDAALLGLLERRAEATRAGMLSDILAAMVGRTGIAADETPRHDSAAPLAPTGFLYAGWPVDRDVWAQVTPNLLKLIRATDPGARAAVPADDPAYLAARLWLAGTRRPVARIAGYDLAMRPSARGGDILDARLHVRVENPVDDPADLDLRFPFLPGDFEIAPSLLTAALADPEAPSGGERPAGDVAAPTLRRRRLALDALSVADVPVPLAGHVATLMTAPDSTPLEITEHVNGAVLRLPVRLPVYRVHNLEEGQAAPKMDGVADDWPPNIQTRVFGEMKVGTRYLARPDLLAGAARADDKPATLRWTCDADYLYLLARCPQDSVSDDRNTEWPLRPGPGGARWWGTDGLQIELAAMDTTTAKTPEAAAATSSAAAGATPASPANDRLLKIAFKPSGVVLVRTGRVLPDGKGDIGLVWKDGPPPLRAGTAASVKYGITVQRDQGRITGYTLEAAIPRAWIEGDADGQRLASAAAPADALQPPAWRVNVLRHRAGDLVSSSWSGPMVDDDDVAMMGALIGQ
jgi:hypothetical protein